MTIQSHFEELEKPSETRAMDVLHKMRRDILFCVVEPGARLPFEQLRSTYNVSFSTLREALTRLVADGLVIAEGQRGFRVAPVTRHDLLDVTNARVLIEREALRLAIQHGDDVWEGSMVSTFHRMDRMQVREGRGYALSPEWSALHSAFHYALVSACGSPTLLGMRERLNERAHRYRALSAKLRPFERDKAAEHRGILDAVLDRNEGLAADLIDRHIRSTTANVIAYASHLFDEAPAEIPPVSRRK
jgi:GntR family transcriptional regulator, carbon starvation induced regulator